MSASVRSAPRSDRPGRSGRRAPRSGASGFSLVEALVAMAILATAAVALLAVVENHTARIGGIEDRIMARWVAENRLAELRVGLPDGGPNVTAMGREWRVSAERAAVASTGREANGTDASSGLVRVTVAVTPDAVGRAGGEGPRVTLTGYVPREDLR